MRRVGTVPIVTVTGEPSGEWFFFVYSSCWLRLLGPLCLLVAGVCACLTVRHAPNFLGARVIMRVLIHRITTFGQSVVTTVLRAVTRYRIVKRLIKCRRVLILTASNLQVMKRTIRMLIIMDRKRRVPFLPRITPVRICIGVDGLVKRVKGTYLMARVFREITNATSLRLLVIARVRLHRITTRARPTSRTVTYQCVMSLHRRLTMINVDNPFFSSTRILSVTLSVVLHVTMCRATFRMSEVFSGAPKVARIRISIIAFLKASTSISALRIFIAGRLFSDKRTMDFFVERLHLRAKRSRMNSNDAVSPEICHATNTCVVAASVVLNRESYRVLTMMFTRYQRIPLFKERRTM